MCVVNVDAGPDVELDEISVTVARRLEHLLPVAALHPDPFRSALPGGRRPRADGVRTMARGPSFVKAIRPGRPSARFR